VDDSLPFSLRDRAPTTLPSQVIGASLKADRCFVSEQKRGHECDLLSGLSNRGTCGVPKLDRALVEGVSGRCEPVVSLAPSTMGGAGGGVVLVLSRPVFHGVSVKSRDGSPHSHAA